MYIYLSLPNRHTRTQDLIMEVEKTTNGYIITEMKVDYEGDLPLMITPSNIHEMPMPYEVKHVFNNSEELVRYLDTIT